MRIKLIYENFKHYWVLSFFICFVSVFISCFISLSFEFKDLIGHLSMEDTEYNNHGFEISVESNIPLSINNIDKYNDYYKKTVSFYSSALVIENNDKKLITEIIEGDVDDFNKLDSFNVIPKNDETIITEELSKSLDISIGDYLNIYIGSNACKYKVVDIIKSKGIYSGEAALIGGRNLSNYYGIMNYRMTNLILIDLEDENTSNYIYESLRTNLGDNEILCKVTNINDVEKASKQYSSSLATIILMAVILMVFILYTLVNIYSYKVRKQRDYFVVNNKVSYYNSVVFIEWIFLYFITSVFGGIFLNIILSIFYPIFHCDDVYKISIYKYFIYSLIIFIVPLLKMMLSIKLNIKKKYKIILLSTILIVNIVLCIIFKEYKISSIFNLILLIICLFVIINFVIYFTKFIKGFIVRKYLYDMNKGNVITKLLMGVQVLIFFISFSFISVAMDYKKQFEEVDETFLIGKIVVSNSFIESNEYEQIMVSGNCSTESFNFTSIIQVDSTQLEKYVSIKLTEEEKEKYDNGKYIILSKHFYYQDHIDVGDAFRININGKEEEFIVFSFVNSPMSKIAYVSDCNNMQYGYLVEDDSNINDVISDFSYYKYELIDVEGKIDELIILYEKIINVAIGVIILLYFIFMFYSIYLFYLDYQYQIESIKKLKILGCSNKCWNNISLYKMGINIIVSIFIGVLFSYLAFIELDNLLWIVKSPKYFNFNIIYLFVAFVLVITCNIIGTVYSNYLYKKIK